ncbi:tripartite tricarboxylate transporter substrate-binding protein [Ramlibacter tataouinensis]|nr:tripartite tricarboxylate transporter substrate-binding protein [Ramlibacter tataouinensis]WBY02773.1 tripartite tricarboxylate transporter substrate-binding protein [Ramlibacter tataouinensis]
MGSDFPWSSANWSASATTLTGALQQIKAGMLRPIAVSTIRQAELIPQVTTLAETVSPSFDFGTWSGIACRRGTSDAIVTKLDQLLQEILAQLEIVERWR